MGGCLPLTREEERDHIRRAVESIAETTGERPLGWYCRYGPSVNTRELVVEEGGFVYDSDAYNDDLPYLTMVGRKKHLVVPYSLADNDGKFNWGAFGSPVDFENHLKASFDRLYKEGETHPQMMSIGLHMRIIGHPGRAQALSISSNTPGPSRASGLPGASRSPITGWRTTPDGSHRAEFRIPEIIRPRARCGRLQRQAAQGYLAERRRIAISSWSTTRKVRNSPSATATRAERGSRNCRCGRGRRASATSPWRRCTSTARASVSGG